MEKSVKKIVKSQGLLARERTLLASERNTLAYIRTGFSSFILGIGLINFLQENPVYLYVGWAAITVGILFIVSGIFLSIRRKNKIKKI